METINFIVKGQIISLDPDCDTSKLVPGTSGYLQAKFSFSPEWDNMTKVAAFFSNLGREYTPQVISQGNTCDIPTDALQNSIFKVLVIGRKNNCNITTNKVKVYQKGGKT